MQSIDIKNCQICNNKRADLRNFLALFQIISPGMHQMALQEVELTTTGHFVCQITMDSPPFEFVEDGGRLTVISLPERFPVISGNKGHSYNLGDWVDLNCTCYDTFPAAYIRWFINGKEVSERVSLG